MRRKQNDPFSLSLFAIKRALEAEALLPFCSRRRSTVNSLLNESIIDPCLYIYIFFLKIMTRCNLVKSNKGFFGFLKILQILESFIFVDVI